MLPIRIDKKFYKPETIKRWAVVSYQGVNRFNEAAAKEMVAGLLSACRNVGMVVQDENPVIKWENPQGIISDQLRAAGMAVSERAVRAGQPPGGPNLIVVVLPDGGNEIYTKVK
ncbi:hypothetical protein H0H87_002264, partial [Tephrocybe sp. NHM501043]